MLTVTRKDETLLSIMELLLGNGTEVTPCTLRRAKLFAVVDGVLCRRSFEPTGRGWLLVVPRHLRSRIMQAYHDDPTAGHLGIYKTYSRLRGRFFWNGMYRSVSRYVSSCTFCQRRKRSSAPVLTPLQPFDPPFESFERIGVDLLGRFPRSPSGNRWVIVAIDHLTRYVETAALPNGSALEVAKFFVGRILLRHGASCVVVSDHHRSVIIDQPSGHDFCVTCRCERISAV